MIKFKNRIGIIFSDGFKNKIKEGNIQRKQKKFEDAHENLMLGYTAH